MFGIFKSFAHDMGIDLGTANTLVHAKGKGIIIRDPSVVAVDRENKEVAIGAEAKQMIGRTPGHIVAIRPMKDGVIADFDITQSMLKYFIKKAIGKHSLVRPRIVVGVPSGVTEVEKRAVIDATVQAGAREAYLIEEPMAAAIGAGLPVQEATGSMVVDIGGGTCEAVISLGGIVISRSIRTGGDAMDDAIVRYIRKTFSLLIGERTAEEIKITIGTAMELEEATEMEIRGRDLVTGLPKNLLINANQICEALSEPVANIVDAVRNTLERTPPELASDIMDRGIVMTGGSSLLRNLDRLLSKETGMPVYVSDDALSCVALGTGIAVENVDIYMSLLLIVIALVALMALAVEGRVRFPVLNRVVIAVISPVNSCIQTFTGAASSLEKKLEAITTMEAENEQLKKENAELRRANIAMAEFYAENQRLTKLLQYKEHVPEQKLLPAKVVGRNMGDLQDVVIIDRGSADGLDKEMAVVTGDGIVGLVEEVYPAAAKVMLITSSRCKIGARILRADSRAVGVICGRSMENMPLEMEHLPREADVRKGDVVITSGFSGRHPAGLVIGTVRETSPEAAGLLLNADVDPAVDSSKVEEVFVVTGYSNPAAATGKLNSNTEGGQAQ